MTLFYLEPEIIWYVGFSGVLHALFSYAVAHDVQQKSKWGAILGIALIIKILYEQVYGAQQSTIELIDAPVLVNAHLYGAIAGIVFYCLKPFPASK
ncbi:rhombosortase [Psychromonas sp. KJ10-10]|uniref:rhombosortase n=1 Tax=Psychromonas sp. KJ10-10 TaxID=3391823 RepID=UPI0039B50DF1